MTMRTILSTVMALALGASVKRCKALHFRSWRISLGRSWPPFFPTHQSPPELVTARTHGSKKVLWAEGRDH